MLGVQTVSRLIHPRLPMMRRVNLAAKTKNARKKDVVHDVAVVHAVVGVAGVAENVHGMRRRQIKVPSRADRPIRLAVPFKMNSTRPSRKMAPPATIEPNQTTTQTASRKMVRAAVVVAVEDVAAVAVEAVIRRQVRSVPTHVTTERKVTVSPRKQTINGLRSPVMVDLWMAPTHSSKSEWKRNPDPTKRNRTEIHSAAAVAEVVVEEGVAGVEAADAAKEVKRGARNRKTDLRAAAIAVPVDPLIVRGVREAILDPFRTTRQLRRPQLLTRWRN